MRVPSSVGPAEFLDWEAMQPDDVRHELLGGEILAFGQGATQEHNELALRTIEFVRARKRPECRAFAGMQRVRAGDDLTYPDIVLTCDERDVRAEDRTQIRYPKLIVEVLSPTTAAVDLIRKRRTYEKIETLEEYLVVDSRERYAALFRRTGPVLREATQQYDGTIVLDSLGAALDLGALYAGVLD